MSGFSHSTTTRAMTVTRLASHVTDPRHWLLALRKEASPGVVDQIDTNTTRAPTAVEACSSSLPSAEQQQGRCRRPSIAVAPHAATTPPPLEERLTLAHLQHIMRAFATSPAVSARPLRRPLPAHGNDAAASRGNAPTQAASMLRVKTGDIHPAASTTSHATASSACGVVTNTTTTAAAPARPLPPTVQGLTQLLQRETASAEAGCTTDSMHDGRAEAALGSHAPAARYDRVLTQQEFLQLVLSLVPDVQASEVLELINKVDYEAQGRITWSELATFLISQSQHRTYMSQPSLQFVDTPDPRRCAPEQVHQLITCYTFERRKGLLVTGGMEGTVRAWNVNTLVYRGLLFTSQEWIVGLHYSDHHRYLFIVTMDRRVYVLDGYTFEPLLLYRGSAATASPQGLAYAMDATRVVRVGGATWRGKTSEAQTQETTISGSHSSRRGGGTVTPAAGKRVQLPQLDPPGGVAGAPLDCLVRMAEAELEDQGGAIGMTGVGAIAYRMLDYNTAALTGRGNGPYVTRSVEEYTLLNLPDAITATAHHCSMFGDETLLLGTTAGAVHLFVLPVKASNARKVLRPSHVFAELHTARVNRLLIVLSLDALLSAGDDGYVRMTSLVNGQPLRSFSASGPERQAVVRDIALHEELKMFVTVGTERHGLVWELAHETPVAVLEPHKSPCTACLVVRCGDHSELVTSAVDGSIHVYGVNGFHLSQVINLDHGHSPQLLLLAPEGRSQHSLLCARQHPFYLRTRRQVRSMYPSTFCGHGATVARLLYTDTFDQLITIDVEAMAMTWLRRDGENVFAFVLNDFSDSATMNTAPLTCAALDGLQRRLITGFRNGAVVVWNVVNGQAINFITAAMPASSTRASSQPCGNARRTPKPHAAPHRRRGGEHSDAMSPTVAAAQTSASGTLVTTDITAVGSLVRHGVTFFLFAQPRCLYTVRESLDFTVATASRWAVPANFGDVQTIVQVSPQLVALGTAAGAVVFYHVFSEEQEGAALWVPEVVGQSGGWGAWYGSTHQRSEGAGASPRGRAQTIGVPRLVSSRVTRLMRLTYTHPHLLLAAHADGTVALWHAFRRVFLGAVNVTAAGIYDGSESGDTVVVDVDRYNRYLVFGDEGGNVHVCRLRLRPLSCAEEERAALALPNPALYAFTTRQYAASRASSDAPLPSSRPEKDSPGRVIPGVEIAEMHRMSYAEERTAFVFDTLQRVCIFGSGLQSITNLLIIASDATADDGGTATATARAERDTRQSPRAPLIFCTGGDNFTRVFTVDGTVVGELGMGTWQLGERSTYRCMGLAHEATAAALPVALDPSLVRQPFFDYLQNLRHLALQPSLSLSVSRHATRPQTTMAASLTRQAMTRSPLRVGSASIQKAGVQLPAATRAMPALSSSVVAATGTPCVGRPGPQRRALVTRMHHRRLPHPGRRLTLQTSSQRPPHRARHDVGRLDSSSSSDMSDDDVNVGRGNSSWSMHESSLHPGHEGRATTQPRCKQRDQHSRVSLLSLSVPAVNGVDEASKDTQQLRRLHDARRASAHCFVSADGSEHGSTRTEACDVTAPSSHTRRRVLRCSQRPRDAPRKLSLSLSSHIATPAVQEQSVAAAAAYSPSGVTYATHVAKGAGSHPSPRAATEARLGQHNSHTHHGSPVSVSLLVSRSATLTARPTTTTTAPWRQRSAVEFMQQHLRTQRERLLRNTTSAHARATIAAELGDDIAQPGTTGLAGRVLTADVIGRTRSSFLRKMKETGAVLAPVSARLYIAPVEAIPHPLEHYRPGSTTATLPSATLRRV